MNTIAKQIIAFTLALVLLGGLFSLSEGFHFDQTESRGISDFIQMVNEDKIKNIEIASDALVVTTKDDKKYTVRKEVGESFSDIVKNYNLDTGKIGKIPQEVKNETGTFWLNTLLPFLIPVIVIAGFIFLMVKQLQGANRNALSFGLSRARQFDQTMKTKISFKDVAGVKEAKEELLEVIEFLKEPQKFLNLGAKIPKGVLLVGVPGTGKTLLAKAVAGEADVPFFHVSGSEFIEMFVGVGASRVRDLFARAKKHSPCIIFVDEIDAVGRQRGAGLGGSNDEREQTLNQILVELDGFEPNVNVIVIAATNRPDVLDPALLRPGRFDRRVILDLPNIDDRVEILQVHCANKPLAEEVKLREVAERTTGFSGADLGNLVNEAAILAARHNATTISQTDMLQSIEKVILGPERKSRVIADKEKKITAFHEGGHALVAHQLKDAPPVQKISIISRGQAAGYTMNGPTEDKQFHTKSEFLAELAVLLGGFVAEQEVFGEVTTGANSDLKKATRLARRLIMSFGMSDTLAPRTFGDSGEHAFAGREVEQRDYSEKTAEHIDAEVSRLIHDAFATAKRVLTESRGKLDTIVAALLEKETLERGEFEKLLA